MRLLFILLDVSNLADELSDMHFLSPLWGNSIVAEILV